MYTLSQNNNMYRDKWKLPYLGEHFTNSIVD